MTNTFTHIESTGIFKTPPFSVAVRAGNTAVMLSLLDPRMLIEIKCVAMTL